MINAPRSYNPAVHIVADSLSCRRGGRMVFDCLSFTLKAGQYLSLRGRNGTGKSTLLRLLAGLIPAHSGTAAIVSDIGTLSANEHIILSGHLSGLKPAMSLAENISIFHQVMTGAGLEHDTLDMAAKQFGLQRLLNQPVQYFSSGQRHRSNLMRFMVLPRQIWLMDEPTVGLDSDNRNALASMMRDHIRRGGMIIAATHDEIDVDGNTISLDDFAPGKGRLSSEAEEVWL